ncbi:MAG: catechol 1,2-dioxygenase [Actinomycetota bacterium]
MSEIVIGVGASHTTLMNTRWDEVDHLEGAHAFRDGLATAAAAIAEADVDLLLVVGTNHFRGFWLDLMPAFTFGVGEVISAGEHGTPSGPQPVEPGTALALCEAVMDEGFDLAFSARLDIDHGISHAIQYLAPDGVPIVPIVVNTLAPPLPTLERSLHLGEAVARAVAALPGDRRVAVVGTGGLSHRLPFPDWRAPDGDDDEFLVESWMNGRGDWKRYEQRRREIVVAAPSEINQDFDRTFLDDVAVGTLDRLPDRLSAADVVTRAGIGANEIRTWLVMSAACGHAPARIVAYAPIDQWLTGMAVAIVDRPTPSPTPNGAPT